MNKQSKDGNISWTDYRAGYIAGMTEGDGTFRRTPKDVPYKEKQRYWRVALMDEQILKRLRQHLRVLGVRLDIKPFSSPGMKKLESRKFKTLEKIYSFLNPPIETLEYKTGYLAGIFDAEGNWFRSNLRIYNYDTFLCTRIINYALDLGFKFKPELYPSKKGNGVRLIGDRFDQAKFLCVIKSIKSRWYLRHIFWRQT